MRNVTPEQVAMAEQHRRGELPDRIEGALGELAGAAKEGLMALSVGVELGSLRWALLRERLSHSERAVERAQPVTAGLRANARSCTSRVAEQRKETKNERFTEHRRRCRTGRSGGTGAAMYSNITIARGVGALFLVSTATYMLGTGMVDSLLSAPSYLTQLSANQAQLVTGVLLQFVNSAAVVAIGVLLFPVLSRQSQTIALGYAGTRMLECAFLAIGGISSLLLVGVSQHMLQAATPDAAAFSALGAVLVAGGHTMYLVAMCTLGLGSLPFCYVLYQTRLIPRPLAMLGLIGYAALLGGSVLELFGMNLNLIHNIPGGLFELLLPLWLIIKGFNQTVAAPGSARFALKGSQ